MSHETGELMFPRCLDERSRQHREGEQALPSEWVRTDVRTHSCTQEPVGVCALTCALSECARAARAHG